MRTRTFAVGAVFTLALASLAAERPALAGAAREEGQLLLATEVLEDVEGMPDQRLPDILLERAYGIAVIPDVTKIAFIFGGARGHGVLAALRRLGRVPQHPGILKPAGGPRGQQHLVVYGRVAVPKIENLAGALGADGLAGVIGR